MLETSKVELMDFSWTPVTQLLKDAILSTLLTASLAQNLTSHNSTAVNAYFKKTEFDKLTEL